MVLFSFYVGPLTAKPVKNIVFMVPDGMGFPNVSAARIYAFGTGSKRLHFESLEQIGYQSTHSANSMVTDSAAAASAWACGEKFNNREISFHRKTQTYPKTILELARDKGKKTGLIATSAITHATPAAFGSHVIDRRMESEIARQYIFKTKVDVILGGGKKFFADLETPEIVSYGYAMVETREQMIKSIEKEKLLGLFEKSSLTPVYKKENMKNTGKVPSLAEMTHVALRILEKHDEGFFLLIEGSQIDWANHKKNQEYMISEILEFDRAVKAVLDWLELEQCRKQETLLIIVPDHDCGGFSITDPKQKKIENSGEYVNSKWISSNHTGEDTLIWSQGPYSQHLGKAIDNTDIFHIIKAALNGDDYYQ